MAESDYCDAYGHDFYVVTDATLRAPARVRCDKCQGVWGVVRRLSTNPDDFETV